MSIKKPTLASIRIMAKVVDYKVSDRQFPEVILTQSQIVKVQNSTYQETVSSSAIHCTVNA